MTFVKAAESFTSAPPYRNAPFSARNWGGKWHSLCSYQGKLKPSIAHFLISEFTSKGDIVLDPLCGVGTIPFEACCQGRFGIGNDLSRLAYVVTKAKLEAVKLELVDDELSNLQSYITNFKQSIDLNHLPYSDFGFNKTLSDYFEKNTFAEILAARDYFKRLGNSISPEQSLVMASILHILHGNRPYALSRHSHSLTPYAPTGNYEYKNLVEHTTSKVHMTTAEQRPVEFRTGEAIFGDFEQLNGLKADAIITSPPFAGSLRFYMQNWMRLWFAGWEPADYRNAETAFLDARQNKDMSVYEDFFRVCSNNLKSNGIMILHLGKNKKFDMAQELQRRCGDYFTAVHCSSEDVSSIEKHGIKDKGSTAQHQFLFMQKN